MTPTRQRVPSSRSCMSTLVVVISHGKSASSLARSKVRPHELLIPVVPRTTHAARHTSELISNAFLHLDLLVPTLVRFFILQVSPHPTPSFHPSTLTYGFIPPLRSIPPFMLVPWTTPATDMAKIAAKHAHHWPRSKVTSPYH